MPAVANAVILSVLAKDLAPGARWRDPSRVPLRMTMCWRARAVGRTFNGRRARGRPVRAPLPLASIAACLALLAADLSSAPWLGHASLLLSLLGLSVRLRVWPRTLSGRA